MIDKHVSTGTSVCTKAGFFLSGASEASSMDGGSRSSWQRVNKPLPVASMSEDNVCG